MNTRKGLFLEKVLQKVDSLDLRAKLIRKYLSNRNYSKDGMPKYNWSFVSNLLAQATSSDRKEILYTLFKYDEKFKLCINKLNIPDILKFGIEIEMINLNLGDIKAIFKSGIIADILEVLNVPKQISDRILQNSDFEVENEFSKWIFSKEDAGGNEPEISSYYAK